MVSSAQIKYRLAIVDPDLVSMQSLDYHFLKLGFDTVCFHDYPSALDYLIENRVDCILMDLAMPQKEISRFISALHSGANAPVVWFMVSAKDDEQSVINAFNKGFDGFMAKPVRINELMVRVQKLLQKNVRLGSQVVYRNLRIDMEHFLVQVDGIEVKVSKSEFDLLVLFVENVGKVFSRHQILARLRDESQNTTSRSVDVLIHGLRLKLQPRFEGAITTVHGVGYKIV